MRSDDSLKILQPAFRIYGLRSDICVWFCGLFQVSILSLLSLVRYTDDSTEPDRIQIPLQF